MTPVVAVAPQNAFIVIRRQYDRAAVPLLPWGSLQLNSELQFGSPSDHCACLHLRALW
jgi:hypothetical protein